jgi:4-amino-4-deoxy-L-arabinose transferase-like glycosyltransferase
VAIRHGVRVLLVSITALVFLPGLAGEFVWDDHELIKQASHVESFAEIWSEPFLTGEYDAGGTYYRPVVSTATFIQYQLFGEAPFGYHLVSLLLHIGCVLLLFDWLLRRFDDGSRRTLWAVLLATAIFAIHPSRPESVSWFAGSTDLWMSFWVLLALWVFDRTTSWSGVAISSLLLILALLSKEVAVMVPVALLLDAFFRREAGEERWKHLSVMTATILLVGAVRFVLFPGGGEAPPGNMIMRVFAATGSYMSYIFWPWEPSTQVGFMLANEEGIPRFRGYSVVLGLAAWTCVLLLGGAALRWKQYRPWARDAIWVLLLLIPVLQIIPLGTKWLTAYRYLYLPMMGVCALVARGVISLQPGPMRMGFVGICLLFVTMSTATTLVYQDVFISEDSLWTYEAQTHPDNPVVWMNLGDGRWNKQAEDQATRYWLRGYEVASQQGNRDFQARFSLKVVRTLVVGQGSYRISDADQPRLENIRGFYDALFATGVSELDAGSMVLKADLRASTVGLGVSGTDLLLLPRAMVTMRTSRLEDAAQQLDVILAKDRASEEVWAQRILVEGRRFRWKEVLALLEKAQTLYPGSPRLDVVSQQIGEAHKLFFQPLPPDWPEEVRRAVNQTLSLLTLGGYQQARWVLEPVLKIHPRQVLLWEARADIDKRDKRLDLMLETYQRALENGAGSPVIWEERIRRLKKEVTVQNHGGA